MKKLLFLFCAAIFFGSCVSDSQEQSSTVPDTTGGKTVTLFCEPDGSSDPETESKNTVFMLYGDSKVKLGEVAVCDIIPKENWEELAIPADAEVACGGWWAGAGDYFYAIRKGGKISVFQISVDEMMEEGAKPIEIYAVKE